MATEKQIEANRRNALKSTGPRTPEGRARSSRNALKHGLASEHAVLDTEDRKLFDQLLSSYRADLQPDGPLESDLVDQIAIAAWRLRRFRKFETGYFNMRLTELRDSVPRGAGEPLRLGYLFSISMEAFGGLARYESAFICVHLRFQSDQLVSQWEIRVGQSQVLVDVEGVRPAGEPVFENIC